MTDVSVTLQPPCLCPSERHKHGISIQSFINLGDTLLQITHEWKTAKTWFLERLLIYQSSVISQVLDFIHWMVMVFSFHHMTGENWEYPIVIRQITLLDGAFIWHWSIQCLWALGKFCWFCTLCAFRKNWMWHIIVQSPVQKMNNNLLVLLFIEVSPLLGDVIENCDQPYLWCLWIFSGLVLWFLKIWCWCFQCFT